MKNSSTRTDGHNVELKNANKRILQVYRLLADAMINLTACLYKENHQVRQAAFTYRLDSVLRRDIKIIIGILYVHRLRVLCTSR